MTRKVFDALVRLFAISVNRNLQSDVPKIKSHFKTFLINYLEPKYVESFLVLFDNYLSEFSSIESGKRLSLNSVKLISYCEDTAIIMSDKEKAIILFNLIRLISETDSFNNSEEFIRLVADIYQIPDNNIDNLFLFFNNQETEGLTDICNREVKFAETFYFCNDVYALQNTGEQEFVIDTVSVGKAAYCYALKESVITFKDQTKLFFNDFISQFEITNENKFEIYLKNISVQKKNKKILHDISIKMSGGDFIGVIGNSGSGKTSLLNAISGLEKKVNGTFYLKSEKEHLNYSYQTQDCQFIPMFTVKEHLEQRADFLQIKKKDRKEVISQISESVGLEKHLHKIVAKQDNSSYQLSGGQQKRLRIAMELMSSPDVFILDEPTSGLSSDDAFKILSLLKGVSNSNKLVLASIHQPDYESLMLFDKLIVLDNNGFPAYYGSPFKVAEYLRDLTNKVDRNTVLELSKNPSSILELLDVSDLDVKTSFWYDKFKLSEMWSNKQFEDKHTVKNRNKIKLNPVKSLMSNIKFDFKFSVKNKLRVLVLLIIPLITGITFALISKSSASEIYEFYHNPNIPVVVLIFVITALFIGMVSACNEYISLRLYHKSDYYIKNKFYSLSLAKFLKYILISFLQTALLVIPALIILKMDFLLSHIFIIIWIVCFFGAMTGLLISIFFKSSSVVYLIAPFVIVLNMLFSGVLIKFDSFNAKLFGQNPSNVTAVANLFPTYPATNAILSDLYLFEDKRSDNFEKKVMFYEAVYYLDYYLPKLQEVFKRDSTVAHEMLIYEKKRNSEFAQLEKNFDKSIGIVKSYYNSQRMNIINYQNINAKIADYCNKNLDLIVTNYYQKPLHLSNRKIDRQFMTAYIPPYYKGDDVIFSPYVYIGNYCFDLYLFTVLKLIVLSLGLFVITMFLKFRYK